MEVEKISTHTIKPSSSTPKHLQIHKLSLLDQFAPFVYTPTILFYNCNDDTNNVLLPQKLELLKQSLSNTLTSFYPFAGKIKDNLSIDCNDEGVPFTEAKANCSLFEFFNQPKLSTQLYKFLPLLPSLQESTQSAFVAMIQVTSFTCGCLAIGAMVSHAIADGHTRSFFLNSWAVATTGNKDVHNNDYVVSPNFDAAPAIFPQNEALPREASILALYGPFLKIGKSTTKRFVFRSTAIENLKAQIMSPKVPNPTRVEAISALIWKCIAAASKANSTMVIHAVNLRQRADPSFPKSYMGNFLWAAQSSTMTDLEEKGIMGNTELHNLVLKLREALSKMNADFVKNLEGEEGYIRYGELVKDMVEKTTNLLRSSESVDYIAFTSRCRFGLYDVDFGWGKPSWVTDAGGTSDETMFVNVCFLMDTPSGDGIESWITLEECDMAILEHDKELLHFAVLDPNPLDFK